MKNTELLEQALDLLHKLEDRTNYEIKGLGEAITLLQNVDIKKEWEQSQVQNPNEDIKKRLEYLRGEIEAERISYAEVAELQSLAEHIDPSDTLLLEWAGVPEGTK